RIAKSAHVGNRLSNKCTTCCGFCSSTNQSRHSAASFHSCAGHVPDLLPLGAVQLGKYLSCFLHCLGPCREDCIRHLHVHGAGGIGCAALSHLGNKHGLPPARPEIPPSYSRTICIGYGLGHVAFADSRPHRFWLCPGCMRCPDLYAFCAA